MTAHSAPVGVSQDQPPLPNQHFSSWLRGQTTLFIGQIIAILTFVLFVAEEVYYISHAGEQGELLKPLTIKLIVDIAHIIFLVVFIVVLIRFLDDNDRGSHRVQLVFARVFKQPGSEEAADENALEKSKKQLKRFKLRFLLFWIGMLALYVCFACQHGYKHATCEAEPKPESESNVLFSMIAKNSEGKQETFKSETNYQLSEHGSSRCNDDSSLEPLATITEVKKHLTFPFVVFALNNFTLFSLLLCFLILYIPEAEMEQKYRKRAWAAFGGFVGLTLAFPALAWYVADHGFTRAEWNTYSAIFDSLSGVANAIVLALLIARLDSKLIGLPSWLISILYSYAAAQPLFVVFELNQTEVFEKITTAVLIFVFVAKIYFFLIVTYAMQTGKMLNYLFCFPILHRRVAALPTPCSDSGLRYVKPKEGWFMGLLSRVERRIDRIVKKRSLHPIGAKSVARLLRNNACLTISLVFGGVAILMFVVFSVYCVATQPGPPLFQVDDLKKPDTLAQKLRDERNPLSEHLRHHFSPESLKELSQANVSQKSQSLQNALVDGLNKAIKNPNLYDDRAFAQLSLTEEINHLIEERAQGNTLVKRNRLLLEAAYEDELKSTKPNTKSDWAWLLDAVQMGLISVFIIALYLVRNENRYGGNRTRVTAVKVFKDILKSENTITKGKKQLAKIKEYFFYFWCAMLLLYVVFFLKHQGHYFGLRSWHPVESKIRVLLYPFLEFTFSSLNLMFIFWCFVILRSPAFDTRTEVRQRLLINYSVFVMALLVAAFPLLLFVAGGPALSEPSLRDFATIFDGVAGTLSAIVWALLIARMNSTLFGLPLWAITILFVYAAIQPLFVVFPLSDPALTMVQTSVLITALLLKMSFFLIIAHSLQSGNALNYIVCFPFLKARVDSVFENQFEIRLGRSDDKLTFSILKKNQLRYSTTVSCETREECDDLVKYLRLRMGRTAAYGEPREEAGTYWVEVRSAGPALLLCESIPLRSEAEARDLINESIEKIPYCKYNRA